MNSARNMVGFRLSMARPSSIRNGCYFEKQYYRYRSNLYRSRIASTQATNPASDNRVTLASFAGFRNHGRGGTLGEISCDGCVRRTRRYWVTGVGPRPGASGGADQLQASRVLWNSQSRAKRLPNADPRVCGTCGNEPGQRILDLFACGYLREDRRR